MKSSRGSVIRTVCLAIVIILLALWVGLQAAQAYPTIPSVTTTTLPDLPKGSYVKGRDGGASFAVGTTRCFTFGDTVLSQANSEGQSWVVNTAYGTADSDPSNGISGGYNFKTSGQPANQWIPWTAAEVTYNQQHPGELVGLWPTTAFTDPNTNKTYIWFGKVIEVSGGWFTSVGTGFAQVTGTTTNPTRIRHRAGQAEDYLMFLSSEGDYGNMAAVVTGGYLYVYYVNGADWGKLRIARASLTGEAYKTRSNWRFWNGSSWVTSASSAAVLLTGVMGGSVSWNSYLNCWLYTYMEWLGDGVCMRVADNLWGPWSAPKVIYRAQHNSQGANPYCGQAHPIYQQESGRTQYTSYSIPGEPDWTSRIAMVKVRFN